MTPRLRSLTLRPLALGLVALAFVATGCGDADDDAASDDATTTTAAEVKDPVITDAWARTSPMSTTNGAAYFVVTGGSEDDEITGASADASVAGTVQIHETVMSDDVSGDMSSTTAMGGSSDGMSTTTAMGDSSGDMSGTTMAPSMEMREVDSIAVPAGEKVELKPGGYHVMLIDLPTPLEKGATFDLTVTFAKAGDQTVSVEVKDAP